MRARGIVGGSLGCWLLACQVPPQGIDSVGSSEGTDATTDELSTEGSSSAGSSDDGLDASSGSEGTDEPPPDPGDPFDPPPPIEPLPEDRLAALQAAIDAWLSDPAVSGADQGVLIIDPATDQVLYERNPDVPRTPASNTKLLTSAAAMDALGQDHRLGAEAWSLVPIDDAGVVAGDLYLLGHHDFSWSVEFYDDPRTPLDLLAESLYDAGLRQVTGGLVAQGEFLYDGYNFGTYDAAARRTEAAARFADALAAEGIAVAGGSSTSASFDPPAGGVRLGAWDGAPLSVANVPLNVLSHNEFADILLRHVGWAQAGTSDYATGAAQMISWYGGLGLDTTGMSFDDGSGLSHGNTVTPRQLVDLLDAMDARPSGEAWRRTFSIAGVRGTLAGRMLGPDTLGRVHGKTGTLTGVIATSGLVYNRWDARAYLFSILMNGTNDASATRAIHDGVIGEVAADIRGQAPPPPAPVLRAVRHDPGTTVASVEWDAVDGAEGYLVWLSPDGLVWDRAQARYVTEPGHRAGSLPFGSPELFVRVAAVGPTGEGDPSDTYATLVDDRPQRALIVDGNDRWQAQPQPENTLGRGHDFAAVHARALAGAAVGWDVVANEAVVDGDVSLADYDLVVWSLGEESTEEETFSAAEQGVVAEYLEAGGALMVSGAELGWDLGALGDANDQAFFTGVLGAEYLGDDAGTYVVRGEGPLAALELLGFYTPGTMIVSFADQLGPAPGSQQVAAYARGLPGGAAVLRPAPGAVLTLGFPFETIDDAPDRAALMERAVELLLP
ncbi:MAG: D-alanyl-D-alanine carboxypeptidase [Myxococcales bacterium]|nr:D-alanyl-D-alanine carboxypeptidase [Myxococcales bacterium]